MKWTEPEHKCSTESGFHSKVTLSCVLSLLFRCSARSSSSSSSAVNHSHWKTNRRLSSFCRCDHVTHSIVVCDFTFKGSKTPLVVLFASSGTGWFTLPVVAGNWSWSSVSCRWSRPCQKLWVILKMCFRFSSLRSIWRSPKRRWTSSSLTFKRM